MVPKALVGLGPSDHRRSIVEGLEEDGFEVSLGSDEEVCAAIVGGWGPGAPSVIVARAGEHDAELLAALRSLHAGQGGSANPGDPGLAAFVVVSDSWARTDDFLDAGAACLLRESDSYEALAGAIANHFYGGSRAAPRVPVVMSATLRWEGVQVETVTHDVSESGCAVTIRARLLPRPPTDGDRIELTLALSNLRLDCLTRVRRIRARPSLFSKRWLIGLEFESLSPDAAAALRELLARTRAFATGSLGPFHRVG